MLPESTERIAPYIGVVAVVGIVWAGLACLVQDDLKRLVAYSSIGHMGFVVLGLATMSQTGIAAAVFGSVAHGLITGLLFFLAGSLKERYGTASLRELGRGLYERAPWRAVAILVGGLATMGLPGFAGFWGELLTLRAVVRAEPRARAGRCRGRCSSSRPRASRWPPPTSSGSPGRSCRASRRRTRATPTSPAARRSSWSPCCCRSSSSASCRPSSPTCSARG